MAAYEQRLSAWLGAHHGVISWPGFEYLGITVGQVRVLVRSGLLRRVEAGVYVAADVAASEFTPWALACAATGGILSGPAAGRLWGMRLLPRSALPLITVTAARHPKTGLAIVRRTSVLDQVDVVSRTDGIWVTSPPRTIFDLAAWVSPSSLESIVEQSLDTRLVTLPTLWATQRRLGSRGRLASGGLRSVLEQRPAGRSTVDSDLELRFERALRSAGCPLSVRQFRLRLASGVAIHPDFAWPGLRLAVEVDHATWHSGRRDVAYDKQRDRKVAQLGWTVLRVTEVDIETRLVECVADVLAVIQRLQFSDRFVS